MSDRSYAARRNELETYFDRTAAEAWRRLTSDAPVSKIRATVRAGRDSMRATLLGQLPDDLTGRRILDAGCGTGALAIEAATRGAEVLAIDIAPSLVAVAAERTPEHLKARIQYEAGDMLSPKLGTFDHVVAMDSLIHYETHDIVRVLALLSERTTRSIHFTFAPRTPALTVMHAAGRLFPRSDRAPAIVPVSDHRLALTIERHPALAAWGIGQPQRVQSGFYTSSAMELRAP